LAGKTRRLENVFVQYHPSYYPQCFSILRRGRESSGSTEELYQTFLEHLSPYYNPSFRDERRVVEPTQELVEVLNGEDRFQIGKRRLREERFINEEERVLSIAELTKNFRGRLGSFGEEMGSIVDELMGLKSEIEKRIRDVGGKNDAGHPGEAPASTLWRIGADYVEQRSTLWKKQLGPKCLHWDFAKVDWEIAKYLPEGSERGGAVDFNIGDDLWSYSYISEDIAEDIESEGVSDIEAAQRAVSEKVADDRRKANFVLLHLSVEERIRRIWESAVEPGKSSGKKPEEWLKSKRHS